MYVLYILVIFGALPTKAKEYVYVNSTLSWIEAHDHCKAIGGELSPVDGDAFRSLNLSNQRLELWTSIYRTFSPWISIRGCFDTDNDIVPVILEKQSVVDCQYICRNYSHFGISGYSCYCLYDILDASKHASSCNIACDGYSNCGGLNSMTVYSTVDQSFIADQSLNYQASAEECVTYRCQNKRLQFETEDCLGITVDHYSCASFHSCSFEPEDVCFFYQDKYDSFDWATKQGRTPTSHTGPTSAGVGMYYAFIEASGKKRGATARLVSNVNFSGQWCLTFKYHMYGSNTGSLRVVSEPAGDVIWSLEGNQGNFWKQVQSNVSFQSHSKVVFEAVRGSGSRGDIAVDDIKLRQAPCDISHLNDNIDTNISWVSRNARCQQKTGSFLMGYENFNSRACFIDSLKSWMGVFKGKTENQVQDTDDIKIPYDIKIKRIYKDAMLVAWVPSITTDRRTFVCNIDGNTVQNSSQTVKNNSEGAIIGVTVAMVILLVISSLIFWVVIYKRKTGIWIWQNIKSIRTPDDQHVYETTTSSTVANDGYAFIGHIAILANGSTEVFGQRNPPNESFNYIEIIANNQTHASSIQGISNIDYVSENTSQIGYENVNVSNKNADKSDDSDKVIYEDFYEMAKPVTSGDEISSEMNENAKKTTNEYELKADETMSGELYDHTTDTAHRELYDKKYGQITYNADDMYDHTNQSRNVSTNVDDMYDHTSGTKQSNSEEQSQESGFSRDKRADENSKVDTLQYYWKLEEQK